MYTILCNPKVQRIATVTIVALMFAVFSMTDASFAAGDDKVNKISDAVSGGMKSIYNVILAIVIPVGAVVFAWNIFKAFFGGERGMQQAKVNILITIVVIALVLLAPLVVGAIGGWFTGDGIQDWDNTKVDGLKSN